MKTLPILTVAAIVGTLGLSAVPALAANTDTTANTNPSCASGPSSLPAEYVAHELNVDGATLVLADNWNGCIRAIYNFDGKSTMVFFNPDTLKVVGGTMPKVES